MTGTMVKNLFFHRKKIKSGAFQSIFCARSFGCYSNCNSRGRERQLDKDTATKLLLDVGEWMFCNFFVFVSLVSNLIIIKRPAIFSFPVRTQVARWDKKDQLNRVECSSKAPNYETIRLYMQFESYEMEISDAFHRQEILYCLSLKNEVIRHSNEPTTITADKQANASQFQWFDVNFDRNEAKRARIKFKLWPGRHLICLHSNWCDYGVNKKLKGVICRRRLFGNEPALFRTCHLHRVQRQTRRYHNLRRLIDFLFVLTTNLRFIPSVSRRRRSEGSRTKENNKQVLESSYQSQSAHFPVNNFHQPSSARIEMCAKSISL